MSDICRLVSHYWNMVLSDQMIVGRYRFGRLLGSGGFGAVYLAEDVRLQRLVALKVCSAQRLPPDEAEEAARLFQREALTLARLRHPGLTAVWDYFQQDEEWFLVMEYVPGETLREALKQAGGRLPVAQAIDYAAQLCAVLRYLHTQPEPVVFRDLKPGNIMVTPEGELKLIDFGIARLFTPGKARDTVQFGTPGYAPPEQYGGQTEPRSDIYSLGAVTHQMLTGHNPCSSPFALPPARAVNPALSPHIEAALSRALAPEPADRFANVDDFCAALRSSGTGTAPAATGATRPISTALRSESISRPLWTPTPRALPKPPRQSGLGRGLILLFLCFVLAGSLAFATWRLRDQINPLLRNGLSAPAPAATGMSLPGVIAYVAPGPEGGVDLFVREGTRVRRLTNNPVGVSAALPAISPDRARIAYGLNQGKQETLWLARLDGKPAEQLLTQYAVARAPSWAPNGAQLAVEVAQAANAWSQHDIVLVDVATGVERTLLNSPFWEGGPAWSPDGKQIAFNGHLNGSPCMRLYLYNLGNGTSTALTGPPSGEPCTQNNGDFWPAWSPDGRQIAFGRKYRGREYLATLDVESRALYEWTTGANRAGHPRWSPDGSALLFEEKTPNEGTALERLDLNANRFAPIDPGKQGSLADWR